MGKPVVRQALDILLLQCNDRDSTGMVLHLGVLYPNAFTKFHNRTSSQQC